jgi:hypothetical protein
MHKDDFYVVLPSNSLVSKALFPQNEPSSFKIKLAQPISLFGNWQVGIAEIHLPSSWRNVDSYNHRFQIGATNMDHLYTEPKEQVVEDERQRQKAIVDQDKTNQKRLDAEKEETDRIAAEREATRIAAEREATRIAEQEAIRIAAEREATRIAEQEAIRIAAEREATRIAAEREALAKQTIKKIKKNGEEKKVIRKPDDIIIELPTPETIIKMEAKEYRNAMHFFRELKRKMKKQNLTNDFLINYHPGKNGKPSAITVSMGDKHGVTFNTDLFWTDTLGLPKGKVGTELRQKQQNIILRPKITNNITLTTPLIIDLVSTEKDKPKQTIKIDPPAHFGSIQELTNLINNQILPPFTEKVQFILDKTKKEIRLKVSSGNFILLNPESAKLWEQLGITNDQIGIPLSEEDEAIKLTPQPPQPLKVDKEISLIFNRRKDAISPQKKPDPVDDTSIPDEVKNNMQQPKLVTKKVYYNTETISLSPKTYEGGAHEFFQLLRDGLAKKWLLDRSNGVYLDYEEPLGKPAILTITGGKHNEIAFTEGIALRQGALNEWEKVIGIPKNYRYITLQGEDQPVQLTLTEPQLEEFSLKIDAKIYLYDIDGTITEIKLPAGEKFRGPRVANVIEAIKLTIPENFREKIQFQYSLETNTLWIKIAKGYGLDFYGGGQSRKQWVDTIGIPRRYVGVHIDHNSMKGATWLKIDLSQMKPPTPLVLKNFNTLEVKKYKGEEKTWIDESITQQADQPQLEEPVYDKSLPTFKTFDVYIEQGHYATIEDLLKVANKKIQLRILEAEYQLKLILQENGYVRIDIGQAFKNINKIDRQYFFQFPSNPIAKRFDFGTMLGFSEDQLNRWIISPGEQARYLPDIRRGVHGIYVYTDLILPQFVGDTLAPLIRVINPQHQHGSETLYKGDTISYHYKNIYYYPLARNTFDTIEINLLTDYDSLLKFSSGKTLIQLHFRRVSST